MQNEKSQDVIVSYFEAIIASHLTTQNEESDEITWMCRCISEWSACSNLSSSAMLEYSSSQWSQGRQGGPRSATKLLKNMQSNTLVVKSQSVSSRSPRNIA